MNNIDYNLSGNFFINLTYLVLKSFIERSRMDLMYKMVNKFIKAKTNRTLEVHLMTVKKLKKEIFLMVTCLKTKMELREMENKSMQLMPTMLEIHPLIRSDIAYQ